MNTWKIKCSREITVEVQAVNELDALSQVAQLDLDQLAPDWQISEPEIIGSTAPAQLSTSSRPGFLEDEYDCSDL